MSKQPAMIRDCSKTLVGGLMQKRGPEKISKNFPVKIEFMCFSMGLTHNFHGKKGGGGLKYFEV